VINFHGLLRFPVSLFTARRYA